MPERNGITRIDGRDIKITRPEKVLFPEDGITKGDLIAYYHRVADRMLPYLRDRALAMQRYPDGITEQSFFQKKVADYYPDWIKTVIVKKEGGTVEHAVCNDAATLVYLANQACITPHIWLSRTDQLHNPDQMILDLDPSGEDFGPVVAAARELKELLDELELPAYLKATGSRGLHVVVPLDRKEEFDSVRAFARELGEILVAKDPEQYTLEQYKNKRRGRVFIDANRNAYAQTAVALYAVRARAGAPVAVPLSWSDLRRKGLRPDGVTLETVFHHFEKITDPWKDFWRHPASLRKSRKKLEELHASSHVTQ
jgi:bifunctional non-homologous end joining protein LigD